MLDASGAIVIPILVIGSTIRDFDWSTGLFPLELVYDKVWMTKTTAQARLLYVWSPLDFLSMFMLQLSVSGCLLTISTSIERRFPSKSHPNGQEYEELLEAKNRADENAISAYQKKKGLVAEKKMFKEQKDAVERSR